VTGVTTATFGACTHNGDRQPLGHVRYASNWVIVENPTASNKIFSLYRTPHQTYGIDIWIQRVSAYFGAFSQRMNCVRYGPTCVPNIVPLYQGGYVLHTTSDLWEGRRLCLAYGCPSSRYRAKDKRPLSVTMTLSARERAGPLVPFGSGRLPAREVRHPRFFPHPPSLSISRRHTPSASKGNLFLPPLRNC
jgi:hypothetical protein